MNLGDIPNAESQEKVQLAMNAAGSHFSEDVQNIDAFGMLAESGLVGRE